MLAGTIIFKRTKTSGLVTETGEKSSWNIYNKLWLNDQKEKGVVPSNLIIEFENRRSAAELKTLDISFDYAKPVDLIDYLLTMSRQDKDALILDSFAGSGTTAHAVLNLNQQDGGNRRFILIEMMDYANTITAERVKRVIRGYGEGKKAVPGTGGSFSYYELGEPLLKEGLLNPLVSVDKVRAYIYFTETQQTLPPPVPEEEYLLGVHNQSAYYFYYEPERMTTLNRAFVQGIKTQADGYMVYADVNALSDEEMAALRITFKKIPRDIAKL